MKTHTSKTLIDNTRGLKFTESPRWHDGKLWFVDIHDKRTKTADLDGHVETAVELPFVPNAFGFQRDGSLLVGDAMQRQIHRWDGKALEPLADLSGITTFCLSDGIVDAQDRGDARRAGSPQPLHLWLGLPRSGRDCTVRDRDPAGGRDRGARGGPSLR